MPEMPMAPGQEQPKEVQPKGAAKGPEETIQDVHGGLMKLAGVVGQIPGAPQGAGEKLAAMAEEFQAIVEALGNAGAEAEQSAAPMEAGVSRNAKPVM